MRSSKAEVPKEIRAFDLERMCVNGLRALGELH
jgi:hypothetical protein